MSAATQTTNSLGVTPFNSQTQAPSLNTTGANDRITVAVVGVGWSFGLTHPVGICEKSKENKVVVAADCDACEWRRSLVRKRASLREADVYLDYRKLLERKNITPISYSSADV